MRHKSFNALVLVLLVLLAGVVGYLFFSALASTAVGTAVGFQISGGFAGFVVTFILLWRVYNALDRGTQELERLRTDYESERQQLLAKNRSLEAKLVRGAPRPSGFTTEVDERAGLVFSRPDTWRNYLGVAFQFEATPDDAADEYPPSMRVVYEPMADHIPDRDEYYAKLRRDFLEGRGKDSGPYRHEIIKVGGEPGSITALKVVSLGYRRVIQKSRYTGGERIEYYPATALDFQNHIGQRVREIASRDRSPVDLANWSVRERQLDKLTSDLVRVLEHGEIRYSEIEDYVRDHRPKPKMETDATDIGPLAASSGAEASSGASDLDGAEGEAAPDGHPARQEVDPIVVPIGEVSVIVHVGSLKKVFLLEFSDNASDWTESSGTFNLVLDSLRFLN